MALAVKPSQRPQTIQAFKKILLGSKTVENHDKSNFVKKPATPKLKEKNKIVPKPHKLKSSILGILAILFAIAVGGWWVNYQLEKPEPPVRESKVPVKKLELEPPVRESKALAEQFEPEPIKHFIKLNHRGQQLSDSSSSWTCVKDNHTDLIWEVKTKSNDKQGDNLHDADDEYTWYNTDNTRNGGSNGDADEKDNRNCYAYRKGKSSSYCNTQAYTARVNAENYCGFNDWRMPEREELRSLVDYSKKNPAINTDYFPHTLSSWYWSGSPLAGDPSRAWSVGFYDGYGYDGNRNDYEHVRLVRGGQ